MKILGLCCFTDYWPAGFEVENHDLKNGRDIFLLSDDYGQNFDLVVCSPPCNQFTVANNRNWEPYPHKEVSIAEKCLKIALRSGRPWFLENPPGRIEKLIPGLKHFRVGCWTSEISNKKYVIYSNYLFMFNYINNNNKNKLVVANLSRRKRLEWQEDFINDMAAQLVSL